MSSWPLANDQIVTWRLRARAELERRRRQGTLAEERHSYTPHGAAVVLQGCEVPQVVLGGPAGTGKSRACLEKLYAAAMKHPGFRGLIARKTRASLTESGLVTFERDVLGPDHPLMITGPSRGHREAYRFNNRSEIVVAGLDKPSRILSAEYDLIYVQQVEEIDEDSWETLTTRNRNYRMPYQQAIGDCNPMGPGHWLKQRADKGQTLLLETRHEDNPVLWDGADWTAKGLDYVSKLDALTGARKQRLRYGRWVQAEGVIYEEWDAAVHLIDRFEIPAAWRRIRVVDFGYTNPMVVQFWAVDPDGRMYRYREIYKTRRTVKAHAQKILELSKGESIQATICDHDAEDRATLEENGIKTLPASKAVSVGLQRVQERLKVAADGRPRLFFLRDSVVEVDQELLEAKKPFCTEQEFDGYVWANKATREEPVKDDDHGMDALRYAVMYQDMRRGVFVR